MTDWWETVEIMFTPRALAFVEGKTRPTEDLVRRDLADAAAREEDPLRNADALVLHVLGDPPRGPDDESLIIAGSGDGRILVHVCGWKEGKALTEGPFAGMTPLMPDFLDDDDGTPST